LYLEKSIPALERKRKETVSLGAKALVHFTGRQKSAKEAFDPLWTANACRND